MRIRKLLLCKVGAEDVSTPLEGRFCPGRVTQLKQELAQDHKVVPAAGPPQDRLAGRLDGLAEPAVGAEHGRQGHPRLGSDACAAVI